MEAMDSSSSYFLTNTNCLLGAGGADFEPDTITYGYLGGHQSTFTTPTPTPTHNHHQHQSSFISYDLDPFDTGSSSLVFPYCSSLDHSHHHHHHHGPMDINYQQYHQHQPALGQHCPTTTSIAKTPMHLYGDDDDDLLGSPHLSPISRTATAAPIGGSSSSSNLSSKSNQYHSLADHSLAASPISLNDGHDLGQLVDNNDHYHQTKCNSPITFHLNQQLHHHHHHHQQDTDLIHGTDLASFGVDEDDDHHHHNHNNNANNNNADDDVLGGVGCGATSCDSDAGYNSGADLFSSSSLASSLDHHMASLAHDTYYPFKLNHDLDRDHHHPHHEAPSSISSCSGSSEHGLDNISQDNLSGFNSNINNDCQQQQQQQVYEPMGQQRTLSSSSSLANNNNSNINGSLNSNTSGSSSSYSDIMQDHHYHNNNSCPASTSSSTVTTAAAAPKSTTSGKRSVLMNLLIDGSDIGAGYTSINCRSLQSTNWIKYRLQVENHN